MNSAILACIRAENFTGLLIADLAARIAQCPEDSVQYSVLVEQQMQYQTQQRHLHQLNTHQLEQRSQQLAEQVKARYTAKKTSDLVAKATIIVYFLTYF